MKKMKLDIQRFNSTNKTTHYEFSQYVANDKPTYLVDYNDDMAAIDTAIYEAKTQADLGVNNASVAQTTAENAQTTANTAVTNAGTAQTTADDNTTKIGDLANLTTANKANLVSAISEVNDKTPQMMGVYTSSTTNGYNADYINQIVESGTDYIRFYNGTQIAWSEAKVNVTMSPWGNIFYADVSTLPDWSKPFTEIYQTIASTNNDQFWVSSTGGTTTNPGIIRLFRPTDGGYSPIIKALAIGKWK